MFEFKKLELSDIHLIKPYFSYSKSMACDNSVGGAFIWREMFNTRYAIYDDIFVCEVDFLDRGHCFTFPLADTKEKTLEGLALLEEYARNNNYPLVFCQVPDIYIDILEEKYSIQKYEMTDWADFIYNAEDIIELKGRKYSKIRNHIHHFSKEFPNYRYEEINQENIKLVKLFFDKYVKNTSKDSVTFFEDIEKTREVLDKFDIYGMVGGCIIVNDNVVAFDIGEVINNVLFVHVEKADVDYNGAFQMIVWEYARHNAKSGMIINREDSAGDEGLDTAKRRWFPCGLITKHIVEVTSAK